MWRGDVPHESRFWRTTFFLRKRLREEPAKNAILDYGEAEWDGGTVRSVLPIGFCVKRICRR